jgi:hypothetical protein
LALVPAGPGIAAQAPAAVTAPPPYTHQTPPQLQQLVAPIALYPDTLVAQILAAATFPEQVVEADRWLQQQPELKGGFLAQAVSQQPWDPSVKALTAFPAVLGSMDKNLSWTSALGDASFNQQQAVMDAVQAMRRQAQDAGTLQSTPEESVGTQDNLVTIEPAGGDEVYLPAYDPWVVYGEPVPPWPDWYPCPGIWFDGPSLSFGIGCPIGFFATYPWGWYGWRFDWRNHGIVYNHERYVSRSRTFYNRAGSYQRAGAASGARLAGSVPGHDYRAEGRVNPYDHPNAPVQPFEGNARAARGYAPPQARGEAEPGAFGGYQHGGKERGFSARGNSSLDGGAAHGGGGTHSAGGGAHHL